MIDKTITVFLLGSTTAKFEITINIVPIKAMSNEYKTSIIIL